MTARAMAIKNPMPDRWVLVVWEVVCAHYDVTESQLLCRTRTQRLVTPRHVAMYLAREVTGLSFPTLTKCFHRCHHVSVHYAYHSVKRLIAAYPEFGSEVETLRARVNTLLSFNNPKLIGDPAESKWSPVKR